MDDEPQAGLEDLSAFDLPLPVFVAEDGTAEGDEPRVVACNRAFRDLLGIGPNEPLPFASARFYGDPKERERAVHAFEEAKARGEHLAKFPLQLRSADQRDLWALDFAKELPPKEGRPRRRLCCLVEFTREESNRRLLNELPVGLYRLDADDRVVECNRQFAELHGLRVPEVLGRHVRDFYADPDEAQEFHRTVVEKHTVIDYPVEVIHQRTKQPLLMAVSSALVGSGQPYQGRIGAVRDLSQAERYRQILDEFPIILFKIRRGSDGVDRIEHCNDRFAESLGKKATELIGQPIEPYHQSPDSYRELTKRLKEAQGETLQADIELRSADGARRVVNISVRELKNRKGKVVGRVGGALDVTKAKKLQEKVDRLTTDIGAVLHAYTHTLTTLTQTLEPVADYLGPDPFTRPGRSSGAVQIVGRHDLTGALEQLLPCARVLGLAMDRVLALRDEAGRTGAWDATTWDRLAHLRRALDKPLQGQTQSPEVAHAYFRDLAQEILNAHRNVKAGHLPRETLRQVELDARELGRLACLLSLASIKLAVVEMDSQVRALRENLTLEQREETTEDIGLLDLVHMATSSQAEYFHIREIELRNRLTEVHGIEKWFVRGSRRDLVRALGNLLHNAIKYSWDRPAVATRPWVELRASFHRAGRLDLSVRNWGVPIAEDEQTLVFELGYRGRYSAERNRAGTGVGLHDARDVAQTHGGEVTIESKPASPGDPRARDYYSHPFITTATLTLPVFSKER